MAAAFKETANYWTRWIGRSTYEGRWREMVHRSALILKLMTSHEFGSLIAAPTFGLPETPGGTRNWDYRSTWIRDASFTVYAFIRAFIRLGFMDEARAYMKWVHDRACGRLLPGRSSSCTASMDVRNCRKRNSIICRDMPARDQCGSAMQHITSYSSTAKP